MGSREVNPDLDQRGGGTILIHQGRGGGGGWPTACSSNALLIPG